MTRGKATLEPTRAQKAAAKKPRGQAARRATPEQWVAAQARWEGDLVQDFRSIGLMLGCSRQRVQQVAVEKGWTRKADMKRIADLAHAKADAHFSPAVTPGGDVRSVPVPPADTKATSRPEAAAEEHAAGLRTDVTVKHRNGWRVVYGLLNEAAQGRDLGKAKLAKTVAESLKITQDGERKAWGMDTPDPNAPPSATVRVIVEREEVKRES